MALLARRPAPRRLAEMLDRAPYLLPFGSACLAAVEAGSWLQEMPLKR